MPLPPPGFTPDQVAASLYGLALLVSSVGTLITVIVGAIRGGKKLENIGRATNGNATAMLAEIKRLDKALEESMDARLASAEKNQEGTNDGSRVAL